MITLGVDIGGSSIKGAGLDGERAVWTGRSERYERPTLAQLENALGQLVRAMPREVREGAEAGGICAPGVLDETGRAVALSVNVPGIVGAPLDDLVAVALGRRVPTRIFTDAHTAAYDLWRTRGLRGRLLAISLGTGVGACVLDDGVPLRVTPEGSSGHLGQVDVSLNFPGEELPIGPDGGRGSLEAYIGLPALLRRYGPNLEAALPSLPPDAPPLLALARAIRIAHAIYRPDHVVLLGGVGVRLRGVVPALRRIIGTDLTRLARGGAGRTLEAGDDEFCASRGAARLAARE